MTERMAISLTVNGESVEADVEPRMSLVDFVRNELGLTGSHVGCEHGVCGACTVRLDGRVVRGCLTLAVQADGLTVETIEGRAASGEIDDLIAAFHERNAVQCGFCTPAVLLTAEGLLANGQAASRDEIRHHLSGNYCRCTGYHAIVDAVETTLAGRLATPGQKPKAKDKRASEAKSAKPGGSKRKSKAVAETKSNKAKNKAKKGRGRRA